MSITIVLSGFSIAQTVSALNKICTGGPCFGTPENGNLVGSESFDDMDGLQGNDILNGRGDNDVMFGDRGDDKMLGGDGNDGMDASFGDDTVLGENGNELIEGDFGADKISGGNGNDKLWQFRSSNLPDNSKDLITCGDGDDTAFISLADGDLASSDCENIVTSAVT